MSRDGRRIRIQAPRAELWAVILDLEGWPTWAPQFERIERIDRGPLRAGALTRVKPRGMPGSTWTVSEYEEGRLFTWTSSVGPGVRLIAGHELTSVGDATDAEFWLQASGPIGGLLSPLLRRTLFRRNTESATEGLKRYVEHARPSSTS